MTKFRARDRPFGDETKTTYKPGTGARTGSLREPENKSEGSDGHNREGMKTRNRTPNTRTEQIWCITFRN